jgi:outer membrane protein OmpA-like peptidoglycan-associated protein
VVNELTKDGVSKLRLIPTGFGDMYPITTGTDKASLQKNRRIELQLTNR